jgi:hypothetical protein
MSTSTPVRRARRSRGVRLLVTATAALGAVVLLAPAALAENGEPPGPSDHPHHQPLTDAQKACLTQHGATLPTPPADGQPRVPLTDAQRQALQAAAKACGLQLGRHGGRPKPALTTAQRDCLSQHGVTPPTKPATGQRPPRLTDAQRQAFQAAAKACGITLPKHPD